MIHNFGAGPSILPISVLEQASKAVLDYNGSGMSILEIGHRTPLFQPIMDEARALVRELMRLGEEHEVLFLHGGATTQFMQVPMNLLDDKGVAAYADTGVWSQKAIKEAKLFGRVEVVCSGKESGYTAIPADFAVPNDAAYFHITTNNTIYGTQWKKIPHTSQVLVADMSSDIFSRSLEFSRFGLIYAGAQKNMGPAGVTLVVINRDITGKLRRNIPAIMDYRNHIREGSMLNTPPVFAVYVSLLNLRWIREQGGLAEMERRSCKRAETLYAEIDRNRCFTGTVAREDRSAMNVCFVATDARYEEEFLQFASDRQIVGIKGHRLSGGFRASLYNALPQSSVDFLVETMKEFESTRL